MLKGKVMEHEELWRELISLPPEGRRQVANLIASLKRRYAQSRRNAKRIPLCDEEFVGMWKDREDLQDSNAWVRSIRKSEWTN